MKISKALLIVLYIGLFPLIAITLAQFLAKTQDLDEKYYFVIGYLVFLQIFGYIIFKHHSKKPNSLLVQKDSRGNIIADLQHNRTIYVLSWLSIILGGIGLWAYFSPSEISTNVLGVLVLLLLPFIILSLPLLLIWFGLRSISEGVAIYYPFGRLFAPTQKKSKSLAWVWGSFYLLIGVVILSMEASATRAFMSCDLKQGLACSLLHILELPFLSLENSTITLALKLFIPLAAILSFIYLKLRGRKPSKR